jgi:LmbE family N-acetylglucosaminyl deacetylase
MELRNKNIVAIIAHPDDETIGCGGLLRKAADQNATCRVVLPIRRGDPRGIANWNCLMQQFNATCDLLGASAIITNETVEDLVAEINIHKIFSLIQGHIEWADIVLTHWHGDSHQAHRAVSRATEIATRPFRTQKTVLCFEIPTSTDQAFINTFSPNCFVTLSEHEMTKKKIAMGLYESEIVGGRTPFNLENQMRLRGSQAGTEFAEAYVIARHFIP